MNLVAKRIKKKLRIFLVRSFKICFYQNLLNNDFFIYNRIVTESNLNKIDTRWLRIHIDLFSEVVFKWIFVDNLTCNIRYLNRKIRSSVSDSQIKYSWIRIRKQYNRCIKSLRNGNLLGMIFMWLYNGWVGDWSNG